MNQTETTAASCACDPGDVTAVILAGGRGQRMSGRDKGLVEIAGLPLVAVIAEILAPQAGALVISANRNLAAYGEYGYPVVPDSVGDFAGPLAGMLSAMEQCRTDLVLTVPCDAPLLSPAYGQRMCDAMARSGNDACVAWDGNFLQPMYALLHRRFREPLRRFLEAGNHRAQDWFASIAATRVDFSDHPEQFYNMNTPADRERLRELVDQR